MCVRALLEGKVEPIIAPSVVRGFRRIHISMRSTSVSRFNTLHYRFQRRRGDEGLDVEPDDESFDLPLSCDAVGESGSCPGANA